MAFRTRISIESLGVCMDSESIYEPQRQFERESIGYLHQTRGDNHETFSLAGEISFSRPCMIMLKVTTVT